MVRSILALALALAGLACETSEADSRPNVLLISLDSVRADFVGAYGAKLPHAPGRSPTPHLDRLAAEGVLFEQAISTTSWTLPAHVSMLTGVPELVHGVEQDGQSIPPDLPTLAETLHASGYRTFGVYSGPYLDPRYGFARGFERYEAGYGPDLARAVDEVAVSEKLVKQAEHDTERMRVAVGRQSAAEREIELASHRDVSSQRVVDLVLDELQRAKDDERPFFVFAHFFDPHYDYNPPATYFDLFDPDYQGNVSPRDYFLNPAITRSDDDPKNLTGFRRVVDDRGLEHLEALYAGEIAWTDSKVGVLLDVLAQRKLVDNTLVIVVGDHGDEFFEHGSIGHRRTLDEEVVRVPWIMRLPGKLAAGERRKGWTALSSIQEQVLSQVDPSSARRTLEPTDSIGRLIRVDLVTREWPLPPACTLPNTSKLEGLSPEAQQEELKKAFKRSTEQGILLTILETFRLGSIKLERERSFAHPYGHQSAEMLQAYYGEDRLADDEHLRWIDLDVHPDEPEGVWSTSFDDPRAHEALEAFRRTHDALLRERRSPPLVEESADMLAALRGLGYVGQEARIGTLASDELVLPPPGERMLGEGTDR